MNKYHNATSYSLGVFGVKYLKQSTLDKLKKWESAVQALDFIEAKCPERDLSIYKEVQVETDTFLVASDLESSKAKEYQEKVSNYNRELWEQEIEPSIYEITIDARLKADKIYKDFGIPTGSWAYVIPKNRTKCEDNELIGIHTNEGIEALDSIITAWQNQPSDYGSYPVYQAYKFAEIFGFGIDDSRSLLPYIAAKIHRYCYELEKLDEGTDSAINRHNIAAYAMGLQAALTQLGKHIDVRKDTGKTHHETMATGIKIRKRGKKGNNTQTANKETSNQIILREAQGLRRDDASITDDEISITIHNAHKKERGYSRKTISKLIPEWTKNGLLNPSIRRKVKL